jgi:tetratricopeptide (TPR) repeat protein
LEAILEESPEAALHLLEDQYPRGFPPSHSHYWKWRILSRIGSEDADEALYRARSADPEYAPDAMSTAAYYFLRGRYGEAAGALDRLLQECEAGKIPIDPTPVYDRTRSRALYLKGLIAFRSGEIGETHRAWERILEEHISGEEKAHAAFRLGSALARHGQPGEGLAYLDMAESLGYGRNARIAHHRGIALESLGDNDGAARELRKSLRLDPFSLKSLDARLVLAGIYEKLGLASLAVSQYERLQRDDPRGFHGSIAMLKSSRISYRHSEEKS